MNTPESEKSNTEQLDSAIDSIAGLINSMASHFIDHPGFMWTESGFEGLHADWPAYPIGHGVRNALVALADFPSDTEFYPIDDIDQCTLFVAGKVPKNERLDSNKHFHIALWNQDIVELAQDGLINDVILADKSSDYPFLDYPDGYIALTGKGERFILLYELTFDVHPDIMTRVEDFLLADQYDTAVREATILLELKMREAVGSTQNGWKLIDECFGKRGKLLPPSLPNSTRLEIRATFRRQFTYVRNEFAHNFKSLNLVTTTRLLRRCSKLLGLLETLNSARRSDKPS